MEINKKKNKMDTQEKIIIYQVFTRLFGNNSLRCKPNGSLEENGCGKMADFTTKALNEIKTLGATHIWYTGIIEHATQTNYTRLSLIHISEPTRQAEISYAVFCLKKKKPKNKEKIKNKKKTK